jgi:hypothetical protein
MIYFVFVYHIIFCCLCNFQTRSTATKDADNGWQGHGHKVQAHKVCVMDYHFKSCNVHVYNYHDVISRQYNCNITYICKIYILYIIYTRFTDKKTADTIYIYMLLYYVHVSTPSSVMFPHNVSHMGANWDKNAKSMIRTAWGFPPGGSAAQFFNSEMCHKF